MKSLRPTHPTVPVLAKGKTDTGRCWIYVRDDRPFGGTGPPAAMFYYSRDRKGEHPQAHLARYAGILQADAYDGYNQLYLAGRHPGPIRGAACWVHARRPFFAMADIEENARRKADGKKEIPLSPIAIEVVRRIDELFEIERSINGRSPEELVSAPSLQSHYSTFITTTSRSAPVLCFGTLVSRFAPLELLPWHHNDWFLQFSTRACIQIASPKRRSPSGQ
ncbi:hypothetical protein ACVIGB_008498 [Bradyrhizobium sp. USDA 4341]